MMRYHKETKVEQNKNFPILGNYPILKIISHHGNRSETPSTGTFFMIPNCYYLVFSKF